MHWSITDQLYLFYWLLASGGRCEQLGAKQADYRGQDRQDAQRRSEGGGGSGPPLMPPETS